jgi:hypothetical protein
MCMSDRVPMSATGPGSIEAEDRIWASVTLNSHALHIIQHSLIRERLKTQVALYKHFIFARINQRIAILTTTAITDSKLSWIFRRLLTSRSSFHMFVLCLRTRPQIYFHVGQNKLYYISRRLHPPSVSKLVWVQLGPNSVSVLFIHVLSIARIIWNYV